MFAAARSMRWFFTYQSQRGNVLKIGLGMIERSMDGLLFFHGGRDVHACIAYNFTEDSARLHSDGLVLLPINFYVTFDKFRTIGRCRLAWRYRDEIGVVFERWVDVRADTVSSDSNPA
jgi:hypothetical protein